MTADENEKVRLENVTLLLIQAATLSVGLPKDAHEELKHLIARSLKFVSRGETLEAKFYTIQACGYACGTPGLSHVQDLLTEALGMLLEIRAYEKVPLYSSDLAAEARFTNE